ncbi:MAG: DUF4124 domain-containing protein [Pseudomonadales bacterium]|nr:DUF4124 domain-containing protein [Pseudomonadales bacterium]
MKTHKTLRYFYAICLTLLILPSVAQSEEQVYYQWLGADGKLNISDHRPEKGIRYQTIKKRVDRNSEYSSSEEADKLQKKVNQAEADEQKAAGAEKERTAKTANEKARKSNCKNATEEFRVISESARVREVSADGEYRYLTDEEKAARGERAQANINKYCSPE